MAGTSNQEGKADNGFLEETFRVDRKDVLTTEGTENTEERVNAGVANAPDPNDVRKPSDRRPGFPDNFF